MQSFKVFSVARGCIRNAGNQRNYKMSAPMMNQQTMDPIQQLFIDKLREYKQRSGDGNKILDPTPEIEKELKDELERTARRFGGKPGEDMAKFPTFKFTEKVVIDPIHMDEN